MTWQRSGISSSYMLPWTRVAI